MLYVRKHNISSDVMVELLTQPIFFVLRGMILHVVLLRHMLLPCTTFINKSRLLCQLLVLLHIYHSLNLSVICKLSVIFFSSRSLINMLNNRGLNNQCQWKPTRKPPTQKFQIHDHVLTPINRSVFNAHHVNLNKMSFSTKSKALQHQRSYKRPLESKLVIS